VADYIQFYFGDRYEISRDKRIKGGSSKRRPDIYMDTGDKIVIVEVDEFQHTSYNNNCEIARVNELFLDVGFR
jgi:hypothetical protein